jgi:inorganic pyrophosphatase
MTVMVLPTISVLPSEFHFGDIIVTPATAYFCIFFGLWSGMIIGFSTEYFTSNSYTPTKYLAEVCKNGPAPNII